MTISHQSPEPPKIELSRDETLRYSRHLIMPEVGIEGQKRLKAAHVLLVGAGGLGSPAALYLAAAGVGTLGIVDCDVVDETNLQRQILHGQRDLGRAKVDSAVDTLADINPWVRLVPHNAPFTRANAMELIAGYDLVIDGTDNFPTRYLINDACVMLGKPYVYGGIFRFEGQVSVFGAPGGPCYRCLFPEPPPPGLVPNCSESGVLGILPGTIGTLQATEAIKLILGIGEPLIGRLLLYDALSMAWETVTLRKNALCPVCGEHPTVTSLIDYEQYCGVPGHATSSYHPVKTLRPVPGITVQQLKTRLDAGERLFLLDVREPHEAAINRLDSVLIPMRSVPQRLDEIPRDVPVIVYCRRGGRSAEVVRWLEDAGFTNAVNLEGGITAWAQEIDRTMRAY